MTIEEIAIVFDGNKARGIMEASRGEVGIVSSEAGQSGVRGKESGATHHVEHREGEGSDSS